mgnify:FL=1
MQIDVSDAVNKLSELTDQLSPYRINLAIARGINHTLAKAKTDAKTQIQKVYNIKSSSVSKSLTIEKASRNTLTGILEVSGKPISISGFSSAARPYQTKKGVSVSIVKGKRKIIKSAFMIKGTKTVRARGKYQDNKFVFRHKRIVKEGMDFPIPTLMTTSVPAAFQSPKVYDAIVQRIETALPKRMEHELRYMLKGGTT